MTDPGIDKRSPRRRWALVGGGVLLAVIAGVAVIALLDDGDSDDEGADVTTIEGPAGSRYKITLPASWRALSEEEIRGLPGSAPSELGRDGELQPTPDPPLAVYTRRDGRGLIVVRREGPLPRGTARFARQLDREFEKRFSDFERRAVRTVELRGGRQALFYSYVRRREGTVHSVVIAPAGSRSYALNTVAGGGANDVAREIGRMIVSFQP